MTPSERLQEALKQIYHSIDYPFDADKLLPPACDAAADLECYMHRHGADDERYADLDSPKHQTCRAIWRKAVMETS